MSGTDSVHTLTAHGILLREVLSDHLDEHGDSVPIAPSQSRTKERTLNLPVKQELPGCYVGQRKITKIQLYIECYQVIDAAEKDLVWLFIRKDLSSVGQIVPGLGGFFCHWLKTNAIDYPVINCP